MTKASAPTLTEVFGIRSKPVLSYVVRHEVDGAFERAIATEHHIVVYGSSKQGKTALRQKHVDDSRCIVVRCNPNHTTLDIYSSVLRQADVRIQHLETERVTKSGKVKTSVGFRAKIPWVASGDVKAAVEGGLDKQEEFATEFISYDFADSQAISELLVDSKFKKFIVLENFHYLASEVQRQLAFDLKTFHEVGIRFIILGIWQEANLLTTHNGDLEDRILEVQVEPWNPDDFRRVAAAGAECLNIEFLPTIIDIFIESAYGNIGMLQEFLRLICELEGIESRQDPARVVNSVVTARAAMQKKLSAQRSSLVKALQSIAAKSRVRSGESQPLLLPYYLVLVVLRQPVDRLQEGIERISLLDELRVVHHREDKTTIRGSDLTNLLYKLPQYQEEFQPPLFYYDTNSRRLRIVDTRQFFVLANADRKELEEDIPYPLSDNSEDKAAVDPNDQE